MWVTALSVGLAVGPVVGGVMLASWWWGSVFLMGVPIMLLALGTARALLPEYRDPAPGPMDLASVGLFLLAVLPVVYAIKSLASGAPAWEPAVAFAAGTVCTVAFVRRQNRLATPLLELRLFHDRAFTGALLTLLLGMMALNGVEYLVPQYLQAVAGQSPLEAGLWLLPGAAGLIVGSQLTPVLARRIRPAYVLVGGLLLSLTGYAAIALSEGVLTASLGLTVIMFGVAPISVLGTVLAVGAAPEEKAGPPRRPARRPTTWAWPWVSRSRVPSRSRSTVARSPTKPPPRPRTPWARRSPPRNTSRTVPRCWPPRRTPSPPGFRRRPP